MIRPPRNKPIRRDEYKRLGFHRLPENGPLTPRLKPNADPPRTEVIGFYSQLTQPDEED